MLDTSDIVPPRLGTENCRTNGGRDTEKPLWSCKKLLRVLWGMYKHKINYMHVYVHIYKHPLNVCAELTTLL